MQENSLILWALFICFCIASILGRGHTIFRNSSLLIASYLFYAAIAWQFLWVLVFSTIVTFVMGIALENTKYKTLILASGIAFFLSILGYLKYRNFFTETLHSLIPEIDLTTAHLILPLGISFYFFEAIGYLIDVKMQKFSASKNLLEFALFIGFFPKIILGPIERAAHFLPQLRGPILLNWKAFSEGIQLILWGIFKKIVIADQLGAVITHRADITDPTAITHLVIAYLFSFQLYFDFSGYTDIAIGSSRLFGISLLPNFRRPYASASIAEFWRRWHMSLSLWFRDYLYIPLGGNRGSNWRRYLNISTVFLLSGLWHGAAWTFVIWGCVHAVMMIFGIATSPFRTWLKNVTGIIRFPRLNHAMKVFCTFHLVTLTWILFYAPSLRVAISNYRIIFAGVLHFLQTFFADNLAQLDTIMSNSHFSFLILIFLSVVICAVECAEWIREKGKLIRSFNLLSAWLRWPVYYLLLLVIILFGRYENHSFIYIRF